MSYLAIVQPLQVSSKIAVEKGKQQVIFIPFNVEIGTITQLNQ